MPQANKQQTSSRRVSTNDNPVALRVSDEEFAAIKYLAESEDRTISSVCRLAIRAWIAQNGVLERMKASGKH